MRGIAILVAAMLAAAPLGFARADDIEVRDIALRSVDEGLALDVDFAFELTPRLVEVVANGVPLYFRVDFELTRSRWYWFDETAVSRRLQLRLSYHALSRQYRLSAGGALQQSFPTLEEALDVLKRVRNWLVVERRARLADADHEAAVRMRLDTAMLPKPFQLSALTGRDLQLESAWKKFIVRAPQRKAR
jgi:hypothetical protein